MLCNFIKISLSPVKVELYDRPRALSRKLAKSFGCPGKKGRRTDRSMVLRVSVSVLEGGGVALLLNRFVASHVNSEKHITHTGMCSTTNGSPCGAAWPAPAGGCPSACRWRPPAEASQHQESPNNFLPLRRKTRLLPMTRAGACFLSWNCGAAPWHRYSWKDMSLLTVAHVYAFALPTEADRKRPTSTHPFNGET